LANSLKCGVVGISRYLTSQLFQFVCLPRELYIYMLKLK